MKLDSTTKKRVAILLGIVLILLVVGGYAARAYDEYKNGDWNRFKARSDVFVIDRKLYPDWLPSGAPHWFRQYWREVEVQSVMFESQDALGEAVKLERVLQAPELSFLGTESLSSSSIGNLMHFKNLQRLTIFDANVTNEDFRDIGELQNITEISIWNDVPVTGDVLKHFTSLRKLDTITLQKPISFERLWKFLQDSPQLKKISYYDSKSPGAVLTDDHLHLLKQPLPCVDALNIDGYQLSIDVLPQLKYLPGLANLDLTESDVTDEWMKALPELTGVTTLDLRDLPLTDAAFTHFADRFPNLIRLTLSGTAVSDKAMEELARCRHLEFLNINVTQVTDQGIAALRKAPQLRTLWCSIRWTSDESAVHVSQFPSLNSIDVGGIASDDWIRNIAESESITSIDVSFSSLVTDRSIEHLIDSGMARRLKRLDLGDTGISVKGAKRLRNFPEIEYLGLYNTPVDDLVLEELLNCKKLEHLVLYNTRVTEAKIDELIEFFPELEVDYGPENPYVQ